MTLVYNEENKMADLTNNKESQVLVVAKPVDAANKKETGDVLVVVENDYIEHNGIGFPKGVHLWMPDDAAKFHATFGTVKRVA